MRTGLQQTAPTPLSQMTQTYWQGVVYGPPGCGKTSFGTISRLPTFVFDVDKGVNTTIARRVKLGMPLDHCMVWTVSHTDDFLRGIDWLEKNIQRFGLVTIDSATELQRLLIEEVSRKTNHLTPEQRDWGVIRVMMERMTVGLRYLPVHLVYTCHEINKMDPTMGGSVWRPSFDGRFAFEYAKHFSYIARLVAVTVPGQQVDVNGQRAMTVQRLLNFGPDPGMHFKDRSGAMAQWEYPDLDSLLWRMMQSTVVPSVQQQQQIAAANLPQITGV